MVQIWDRPWHDGASFVGPAWSISAEWLAYVLFPLTALVFFRLRGWPRWLLGTLAVLLMAPVALLCLRTGSLYFPYSWAARILAGFTAGALVYLVVGRVPRTPRLRRAAGWASAPLVAAVLGVLWYCAWLGPGPRGTERGGLVLVLFPALIGALALASGPGSAVGADQAVGWVARALSSRWAVHGGRISYSLYLVHVPMFEVYWTATERIRALNPDGPLAIVLTPLVFLATFGVAQLLYTVVEEPARRRMRGIIARREFRACG
jgi:peptidoglycan/LPS O-acetylase OafA/YrhL